MVSVEISEERIRRLVNYLPLLPQDCKPEVKGKVIKLAVRVTATSRVSFLPDEVEKLEESKKTVLAVGVAAKFFQESSDLSGFLWETFRARQNFPEVFRSFLKGLQDWNLISQAVTVLINGQVNTAAIREAMIPLIPAPSKSGTPNLNAIEALANRVASSYPVNYFPKEAEQLFGCKKIVLAVGLAASFLLQSKQVNIMNFLRTEYAKPTEYPATLRELFSPKHPSDWRAVCEAVKTLISSNTKDQAQDEEFAMSWFKAVQGGTGMLGDICDIVLDLAFGPDTEGGCFTVSVAQAKKLRLTHPLSFDSKGTPFELLHVPRTSLVMLHAVFGQHTQEQGYVCVGAEGLVQPSPQRPSLRLSFEVHPKSPDVTNVMKFHLPGKPGYYLTESKGKLFISPFGTEFILIPTTEPAWEPRGCTPLCDINQECAVHNEDCEYYCFRGDCRVLAANGELVRVSELRVGDRVRVLGGKVDVVEACVCSEVAGGVKEMVTLPNGVCLTSGHPVMTRSGQETTHLWGKGESGGVTGAVCAERQYLAPTLGSRLVEVVGGGVSLVCCSSREWSRPRELVAPRVEQLSHLFNFALRDRGALLVTGPQKTTTLEPLLGGEEEVSLVVCGSLGQSCPGVDDSTSFFGSERVIAALKRNPQWPHIRGKNTLSRH